MKNNQSAFSSFGIIWRHMATKWSYKHYEETT